MNFSTLNKKNAQAFFDLYMQRKDDVLKQFSATVEAGGGPAQSVLDFSPESFIPLWAWLRKNLEYAETHPPLELLPPWYEPENVNNPSWGRSFTIKTAHLLDGFAYYYGEVHIRNLEGLSWGIGSAKPITIASYNPVVTGKYLIIYPLWMVFVAMGIAHRESDERNCDESEYISYGYHVEEYERRKAQALADGET